MSLIISSLIHLNWNLVLLIHDEKEKLKGTRVLKHIQAGESKLLDKRPTCSTRERWYDLGERKFSDGFWIYVLNDRYCAFYNLNKVYTDCELFDIYIKNKKNIIPVLASLNSTITALFSEIGGRTVLGQGALKNQVYEVNNFLVIDPLRLDLDLLKKITLLFTKINILNIESIFDEIGTSNHQEVCFDKIKPLRQELDKIFMGDILGLTEDEQLEVYRAIIDLVKSRLNKAKSFDNKKKSKVTYQLDEVKDEIVTIIKDGI